MHSNSVGFTDGDVAALAEIVAEVEKTQSVIAAAQAAQARALAKAGALARTQAARPRASVREHDMALRGIAAEVAGVLRVTDRSVQRRIDEAVTVVEDYPATLAAWEAAAITAGHVRVILEAGAHLPADARAGFDLEAARRSAEETPGRVRDGLRLLAERLHPRTLDERHIEARRDRAVRVFPIGDGMSDLCARIPSLLADAIHDRLTQQARVIVDADRSATGGASSPAHDVRSLDNIRADVLTDMLLTAGPTADPTRSDDGPGALGAIRAKVQVVVPVLTLLGGSAPAELVGHSPIDPATARELAGATRSPLERVLTHPVTGAVLHVDAYQRTAAIDRHLRARDQHCRFPGCRLPAARCEVDHTIERARGGPTEVRNLAHLCQRHHSMKQFTAWRVRQLDHGVLEWTTPLGRVYRDHPSSLGVHFDSGTSPREASLDSEQEQEQAGERWHEGEHRHLGEPERASEPELAPF